MSIKFFGLKNILLILVFVFAVYGAGEVDTSFNASITTGGINVAKTLFLPDGKILASGQFRVANGTARTSIARFNSDGTLDSTFNPPDFFYVNLVNPTIYDFELQSNGKIIVAGDFFGINNILRYRTLRLNTDGSLDETFASVPLAATMTNVEVFSDDRIVVSGHTPSNSTYALTASGLIDTTRNFNAGEFVYSLLVQPDGKLLVAQNRAIKRFNVDGSQDVSYPNLTFSREIYKLVRQPDGKILVGGVFETINGFAISKIARLNENGTIDGTFSGNGAIENRAVSGIAVAPNGKIAIAGSFTTYQGTARNRIALLNSDGTLDLSFNYTGTAVNWLDTAFQPDGKLLVGGVNAYTRLNIDGSVDTSFQAKLAIEGVGRKVLVQPDGKIIVAGRFLARFSSDGTLDTTFNPPNLNSMPIIYGGDLQPDGKVLVVGDSNSNNAYRLNSDGSLDFTFPTFNTARDVKVLPDGKILISVTDLSGNQGQIRRFNSNGTSDGTFATTNGTVYKMFLQPDGKLLIGGSFTQVNSVSRANFARLNADGSLDTSFNTPGGANGAVNEIASQSNGKIIIGGEFTGVNFDLTRRYLARLNADGSLDTTFAGTAFATVVAVKIQANDKILFGSWQVAGNGNSRNGIIRLNSNGSVDNSFVTGIGSNGIIWDIEQQSNGKIVFCGNFSQTNGLPTIGLGRLLNNTIPTRALFDYDGDGRADVSVFRPSTNRWYQILSGNGSVVEQTFGVSGDIISPADYDGDGKTDIGIFRPSNGNWWYLSSVDGGQKNFQWGANGDIPRPSDFDGDGKADFIIFRPAENNWYRFGSLTGVSIVNFGLAGDKPVTGDFDGDGKSDVAIYRPSTGDWWYQSSINGAQLATRWGIASDIPTPADFDGDGKTDFAVYRASTGVWYIYNSSNASATIMNFGLAEDKPVAADYDGDGKADIAVFRPSTGIWYLMRSTAGFTALQFGVSTDIPTQNAFVP